MTEEAGWVALGVKPELDRTSFGTFGRTVDSNLAGVARKSGHSFGNILGKAALAGAAGIIGAGFAAFRIGQDALSEARESQEIARTSSAILQATGHAAKLTRKEYDGLVQTLMRKTAIDDEQIQQSGNLLLTFKNIKREGKGLKDIFGRSLSSALDLSAAGFGSTDSAAKMLGKALNDPVKGVTALSRAGVTFSEDQKLAIASMVESNNLLGAQKLILKEVESQVGGTAAKQKTSAKELEVAWGNVKEELGFALIPVMDDLADVMLKRGIPAAREFAGWIKDEAVPGLKGFADEAGPLVKKILPAIGDTFSAAYDIGKKLLPVAEGIVGAFLDMPKWAQTLIVGGAGAGLLGKKTGLFSLFGGSKGGLLSKATPVPVFVTNMGGGLGGTPGAGTKPKGKLPLVAGLSPYLLPFLLSGDTAPGQKEASDARHHTPDEIALSKGVTSLFKQTGTDSTTELFKALNAATRSELVGYRRTLREELGLGFRDLSKFKNGDGESNLTGLTDFGAGALRRKGKVDADLFKDTFATNPNSTSLNKTEKDFLRLIGYRNDLLGHKIEPAIRLQGADAAQDSLRQTIKLMERAQELAAQGIGPGRADAPTFVNHGTVTYTDDEQGRRDAKSRARRSNMDGWR